MEFASKHVYLGAEEEQEVDDDVLQSVEAAGGLLQAVRQSQAAPAPAHADAAAAAAPLEMRDCEEQLHEEPRSLNMAGLVDADEKPKKASGGFLARLFGKSAHSGSSDKDSIRRPQRNMREQQAPPPPPPPAAPQGSSFLNFLSRNAAAPSASPPPPPAGASASSAAPLRRKAAFKRAVDTNVVAIKLGTLAKSAEELFAGDVIQCERCGAALNHLSNILDHEGKPLRAPKAPQEPVAPGGLPVVSEAPAAAAAAVADGAAGSGRGALPADVHLEAGQQLWSCDFCEHHNVLDGLQPEEIPAGPSRDYVLVPAPESASASASESDASDSSILVFVLDISGSMCVSSAVPGRIELRGRKEIDPALLALGDVDLAGVGANARVTYISRLQSVQASIDAQLTALAEKHPKRRVLLVTFNGEVTIVGDGSAGKSVVIAGDKLQQEAELARIGRDFVSSLDDVKPVVQAKDALSDALFSLEESGPTALGPALVCALAMASRVRGSQVILCTDGVANVGLGSIDTKGDRDAERSAEEWYRTQGVKAREAGTMVSIVSIKGDECRLELLGLVAAETLGAVTRVDPLSLRDDFAAMLANPVLATNVQVTFFLHEGMQFRNEDAALAEQAQREREEQEEKDKKKQAPPPSAPADADAAMPDVSAAGAVPAAPAAAAAPRLNKLVRTVGNVTRDSEVCLEYGLRSRAELARYAHLPSLPFQAQIRFTLRNGMQALRVLTQAQDVTTDRAVAEKNVKLELLSAQVASKSAALARDGRYKEARMNWLSATPMLARAAAQSPAQQQTFSNYAANIDQFDRVIAAQQRKEKDAGGASSDEEDWDDAEAEVEADGAVGGRGAPAAGAAASAPPRARKPMAESRAPMKSKKKAAQSDEVYRVIHKTHQLNSAGLL